MKIGGVELRNEFIMAPIKTGYSDDSGQVKKEHLDFYRKRAQDVGAVIPEPFYLEKSLREIPTQLGIDDDNKLEGLKELNKTIHEQGAKSIAHLNHPGRMANPKLPGNKYLSSTDRPCKGGGAEPEQIDKDDIQQVIDLFKDTAVRAQKADFDLIELQFGHGYLAAQFLSPAVNKRDDEYGGSFDNRTRFPLEVLKGVKEAVDLPIIVRISADEMIENGLRPVEMVKFVKILEEKGINAVHVSAGTVCSTPPWYFQHMFIPKGKTWELAAKIKSEINIPVIAVGKVNKFTDIDFIKEKGMADFIAIGRALVADPHFVAGYLNKEEVEVRPCLACTAGCLGGARGGS